MWRGETWTFTRSGEQDRTGDRSADTTFTVDGCVFWFGSENSEDFGRESVTSFGTLAVPESADVVHTDRPRSPSGDKYVIDGLARWNGAHPLTGWRHGFKLFRVKGVT